VRQRLFVNLHHAAIAPLVRAISARGLPYTYRSITTRGAIPNHRTAIGRCWHMIMTVRGRQMALVVVIVAEECAKGKGNAVKMQYRSSLSVVRNVFFRMHGGRKVVCRGSFEADR
jgi:hypothetical protein